ncbi:hypothetical protein JIN77_06705 [Verrucomicrobiaceae bacterium R5-34]|nr:hypothetical protein [Verrucomicrobiaceae bacterium R5-34]
MNIHRQNPSAADRPAAHLPQPAGFALIATISVMVLLVMIALAMLTLSTIELRTNKNSSAMSEAQANARMALMLAIGELQKEMGPDMRISAESAIFDQNHDTEEIDGVDQSRWLASYHAWGSWLNSDYTLPDNGDTLEISDTYTPQREKMFRRWLLSLPEGMEEDVDAPITLANLDDDNSVIMVGEGSLGDSASNQPDQVTRAYLVPVETSGKHAWWIGPENHKAKVNLAKSSRSLSSDAWETSQGDTAEVGVGAIDGLDAIDDDESTAERLITRLTLQNAAVDEAKVQEHFFDLTANSQGVIASVRTGHLKKDLSLLFENDNSSLPDTYEFQSSDIQEPSVRPMSADLLANNPTVPNRHFASWTNMRHYYRMYRNDSDATVADTGGKGSLDWTGSQPSSDIVWGTRFTSTNGWDGSNNYWRFPVLAKLTYIYSLLTEEVANTTPTRYKLYLVFSPVLTYWNPYNTPLVLPSRQLGSLQAPYKALPIRAQLFLNNTASTSEVFQIGQNLQSFLTSDGSSDITFEPGEIKLFSLSAVNNGSTNENLYPGFDPQAIGGMKLLIGSSTGYTTTENPGVSIDFSHSVWGGNINFGNTPGSLVHVQHWGSTATRIPLTYNHDWLQVDQTYTSITGPEPAGIARWVFGDTEPLPVAFSQLAIKGVSEMDYESIDWEEDWRGRNWLHSPPFYNGSMLYMSEDDQIAHTQRLDDPYIFHFGPTSQSEMPRVVGHLGERAFLGSGTNPVEQVTSVVSLELPTAPLSSLASFSNMRINPGWAELTKLNSSLQVGIASASNSGKASLYAAEAKALAYQSGVTGPGIGNSFIHPMIARDGVYTYFDNSKSQDPVDRSNPYTTNTTDNKLFNDYWDHVFLLNDALWDDYFVSSLADQTRPGASSALSLSENLDQLVENESLANSRYHFRATGQSASDIKAELQAQEGYLKAAKHLMVDGMFNVNSTSVPAWTALFAGIRERQLVYRNGSSLQPVSVPSGKRIALSRYNTEISDQEMDDPETGANLPDGSNGWTGVRYLDDDQILKLAEECVKQVKQRGPFLNYSEFINRRLSTDELGLMGALQSAIDYDDSSPQSGSINYRFKNGPDYMMQQSELGSHRFQTPEATAGSRFAGIPGYVIQSDLLKPISNTLAVRDDTFRIRAYGESLDSDGNVTAKAWCEAIVQRSPEYCDPTNEADVPARILDEDGEFSDNAELSEVNSRFGRQFNIISFRWLNANEV